MKVGRTSGAGRWSLAAVCALLAAMLAAPAARAQSSSGLGQACQVSADCGSRNCISGMCCETACMSSCQSCFSSLTGVADGLCRPVKSGQPDPQGLCGTPVCNGTMLTGGLCNGSYGCQTASVSCAPYACSPQGNGCNATCSSDSDCTPGATCEGVTCTSPEGGLGASGTSFDGPSAWNCATGGRMGDGGEMFLAAAFLAAVAAWRRVKP